MADIIKCPTCGAKNAADQEFCQFCQSRLLPLTGPLKGLDAAIKPGQIPTKKDTGQLEPILPEWLREARSSAKKNSEEEALQAAQKPINPPTVPSGGDLLAGLQSHAMDEEEDAPDWLTNITGEIPKSKKVQPDSSEVRWVELGAKKDFAQEEPDLEPPSAMTGTTISTAQTNEKDELTDWFQDATNVSNVQEQNQPFGNDPPDWLQSMPATSEAQSDIKPLHDSGNIFDSSTASSDIPDWLQTKPMQGQAQYAETDGISETVFGESEAGKVSSAEQTPDWLKGPVSETPIDTSSVDLDWMNDLQAGVSEQPIQGETPVWLRADVPADETQVPVWLTDTPTNIPVVPVEKPALVSPEQDDDTFGDVPNWLKAAAPKSSIFEESPAEQNVSTPYIPSSDTSDWLNAFKSDNAPEAQKVPAFVNDSQSNENSDALFTEMPDWLSNVDESTPKAITNADTLAPANDLPSWVQAMRPVDSGISQSMLSSYSSDKTLESRGALAGLLGVLPAVPGFTPTSKPKAYSIKLQASEEQQAHADLLERILAAETEPVPITSFSLLSTSRGLRWLLAIVLFLSLGTVLLLHTQIFPMPTGVPVPPAVGGSLQVAQSIPNGAAVLVAFDFEPARVGEMEVAAAPMFDQMLLLHRPRLIFISTNASGPILTERFISGPLAGYNYQNRVDYLNLGFLPGGQMGINAFAQRPQAIAEFEFARISDPNNLLDISLSPAWILEPWKSTTSLSQFAAFIILTDNADSARAWIEQTTSTRGTIPVVVISSAQAAPMIQPYYASRQISGLVSGLYGAAVFEQNNAGRPGTARTYWDAYNIGMLLAMVLILGGGLWNFVLGLRDRAAAREAK